VTVYHHPHKNLSFGTGDNMKKIALLLILVMICGCGKEPMEVPESTAGKVGQSKEITEASKAFKSGFQARMNNNYEVSRKLLFYLNVGMATSEVEELLGPPDRDRSIENETYWSYTLFYSQFIDIVFDPEGNVKKIHSTVGQE